MIVIQPPYIKDETVSFCDGSKATVGDIVYHNSGSGPYGSIVSINEDKQLIAIQRRKKLETLSSSQALSLFTSRQG